MESKFFPQEAKTTIFRGVASKESVVNNIELETDRVVTIKIRCHMHMTDRAVFVSLC
jgi:hypothetical protein